MTNFQFVFFLVLSLFSGRAAAQQTDFQVEKLAKEWTFDVRWKDQDLSRNRVAFSLPAGRINHDLSVPLRFDQRAANVDIVRAINEYGDTLKKVTIKARVNPGGSIDVRARGPSKATRNALNSVKQVQKEAMTSFLHRNGFSTLKGKVIPNHARYASIYARHLAPLAQALGAEELHRRQFAERALSFVQAIPYDKTKSGADKGFRLPLAVLGKNRGDCDSKAVLFLALMKAAYPKTQSAIVYIKGHAFVALGMSIKKGDVGFDAGGRTWLIAEPVGPALLPLGDADKASKRKARLGKISIRRVKTI